MPHKFTYFFQTPIFPKLGYLWLAVSKIKGAKVKSRKPPIEVGRYIGACNDPLHPHYFAPIAYVPAYNGGWHRHVFAEIAVAFQSFTAPSQPQ